MQRFSPKLIADAINAVNAMDHAARLALLDDVAAAQPYLLGTCLVQPKFGVPLERLEFLVRFLLVCYEAMKRCGECWPVISEDDIDRQSARFAATVKFSDGLDPSQRDQAMAQYIQQNPEPALLAYVQMETSEWLQQTPHATDSYLVHAAWTMVNCLAHVPHSQTTSVSSSKIT